MKTKVLSFKKAYNPIIFFLGIMIGGFLLLLRNPDPVIHQVIYAEDGVWTAMGLRDGWLQAFVNARPDYFVVLNVFLLFMARVFSLFLDKNFLEYLPLTIAIISFGFYAFVSTLVFFTMRKVVPYTYALLAYLITLLLPLGNTQNEIIGRILQIGFYMPILAVMLFFWRDILNKVWQRYCIDFCLLVLAATNPIVLIIALIYLVFDYIKDYNMIDFLKRTATIIVPFFILALFLFPRFGGQGGIPGELVSKNIIESIIARPLLYPFVFPWYNSLSNKLSLIIFGVLVLFIFFSYRKALNDGSRHLIIFTSVAIGVYDFATIFNRPGLSAFLVNYQATFPDRYFMGINVLVSFLIVLCLAQFRNSTKLKILSPGLALSLIGIYLLNTKYIFEINGPKEPIMNVFSFPEQLCLSHIVQEEDHLVSIPIYPEPGWKMRIPRSYVNKNGCNSTIIAQAPLWY